MLQDSLIHFLHLAHTGIKGAAFLPGGEPASGADVGEKKRENYIETNQMSVSHSDTDTQIHIWACNWIWPRILNIRSSPGI